MAWPTFSTQEKDKNMVTNNEGLPDQNNNHNNNGDDEGYGVTLWESKRGREDGRTSRNHVAKELRKCITYIPRPKVWENKDHGLETLTDLGTPL